MKKHFWLSLSLVNLAVLSSSGCAVFKDRKPAAERDTLLAQIYNEVANANNKMIELTEAHDLKISNTCSKNYGDLYQKLFDIAGVATYFENTDLKSIDQDIEDSFTTRLALKESFANFNVSSPEDAKCLAEAQDVFKALRYVEDYLVEVRMDKLSLAPSEYVNMKGDFPYFLINPKFANEFKSYEDLKSGDVILSRGNAYSSAAIARIGKSDYQFSHLSFVYRDADTKELFTSEAHIEIGSIVAPFSAHINEKNVRSLIMRHKDESLANKAAKAMYDRVKKEQATGKAIAYDFSMNYKDDTKLFCSEIVSQGFKLVNPEGDYLPKFKSKFTVGMIPFLNDIGVPVNESNIDTVDVFAPGDIQFDPNFEIVAEWRNPKRLEESRIKDFILTRMFERMDTMGYKIDPSLKMDIQSRTFWLLRRTPIVKKFIENKFSLTMNPTQMEIFMALDKIGDTFYKNLELRSIEFDHAMTPKEIYEAIDEFIKKDLDLYKKYKKGQNVEKPLFHLLFHP